MFNLRKEPLTSEEGMIEKRRTNQGENERERAHLLLSWGLDLQYKEE
jgi:hypothetical protein